MAESFVKILLLGVCLALFFVAVVCAVVDPYAIYLLVEREGFNAEKFCLEGSDRAPKSVALRTRQFDGLVLGTSRAMVGIDPLSEQFDGKRVYNGGLNSTNMWEIEKVATYANKYQNFEMLIVGLDFLTFSNKRTFNNDYKSSGFSGRPLAFLFLERSLSWYAFKDSWKTIVNNRHGLTAQYTKFGFRDMSKKKEKVDHRELFATILTENFLLETGAYGNYVYSEDRMEMLRNVARLLMKEKAHLYLFISPVHARQLEALRVQGLFGLFEEWKRDLVELVSQLEKEFGAPGLIELWDFSGYNSIQTEPVPDAGTKMPMKWYWESSHYKKETGDLVLARMFGKEESVDFFPDDFGVMLTKDNLEDQLLRIRKGRAAYLLTQPQEVAEVERLAKECRSKRR